MKTGFILVLTLLLWGCSGERSRLQAELDRDLMSCDSTIHTLTKTVTAEEMNKMLEQCAMFQQEFESNLGQSDTLSLAQAQKIDRVMTAFKNTFSLSQERKECLKRAQLQRQRIELLKLDIKNVSGSRSEYSKQVRLEKRELTKIRTHCNDIRLRFEELKSATSELHASM